MKIPVTDRNNGGLTWNRSGMVPRAKEDPYALSAELRERLASIPRVASTNTNSLYRRVIGKKSN
jgi:hypothetical protein